ncbi:unnamed protein product [Trichogramma brassicae]|uniref:Uncharacterized protein n=1 Tax=Trichogramma brassicae TaxID=86971 RepID=A0A6H5IE18_9HYME|nr:unnamed protein product [Trichogramma brassicae]
MPPQQREEAYRMSTIASGCTRGRERTNARPMCTKRDRTRRVRVEPCVSRDMAEFVYSRISGAEAVSSGAVAH